MRQCCQTVELDVGDCVLDPETDLWRPASRRELARSGADFPTLQDPDGERCEAISGKDDDALTECLSRRSLADRRGYCLLLEPTSACPLAREEVLDPCEQLNMGLLDPPD